MNTQITITPAQLASGFVALCVGFAAVAKAASYIAALIQRIKKPEETQNDRLSKVEEELKRHQDFLASDKKRLDAIEEGNRMSMRAQLALLSHSLDGNDVEALRESKKELQEYLIKR
jgi:hypothetical protein